MLMKLTLVQNAKTPMGWWNSSLVDVNMQEEVGFGWKNYQKKTINNIAHFLVGFNELVTQKNPHKNTYFSIILALKYKQYLSSQLTKVDVN